MTQATTFAMRRAISAYALFLPLSPWRTEGASTRSCKTSATTSSAGRKDSIPQMSAMVSWCASVWLEVLIALAYLCLSMAILPLSVLDAAWYWVISYWCTMILLARSTMVLGSWVAARGAPRPLTHAARSLRRTSLRYISQNSWHSSLLRDLLSPMMTWWLSAKPTTATNDCATKTPSLCAVQMSDSSFESL